MNQTKYIVLYVLRNAYNFYIGCGDENTRLRVHRWKLSKKKHTEKLMVSFERYGSLEYVPLARLPYTPLNNKLLKKLERVLMPVLKC